MKKKLIASILAAVMVTSVVPATAFAATTDAPSKASVKAATYTTAAALENALKQLEYRVAEKISKASDEVGEIKTIRTDFNTAADAVKKDLPSNFETRLDAAEAAVKTAYVAEIDEALAKIKKDKIDSTFVFTTITNAYDGLKNYDSGLLSKLKNAAVYTDILTLNDMLNPTSGDAWDLSNYEDANDASDVNSDVAGVDEDTYTVDTNDGVKALNGFFEDIKDLRGSAKELIKCYNAYAATKATWEDWADQEELLTKYIDELKAAKYDTDADISATKALVARIEADVKAKNINKKLDAYKNVTTGYEVALKDVKDKLVDFDVTAATAKKFNDAYTAIETLNRDIDSLKAEDFAAYATAVYNYNTVTQETDVNAYIQSGNPGNTKANYAITMKDKLKAKFDSLIKDADKLEAAQVTGFNAALAAAKTTAEKGEVAAVFTAVNGTSTKTDYLSTSVHAGTTADPSSKEYNALKRAMEDATAAADEELADFIKELQPIVGTKNDVTTATTLYGLEQAVKDNTADLTKLPREFNINVKNIALAYSKLSEGAKQLGETAIDLSGTSAGDNTNITVAIEGTSKTQTLYVAGRIARLQDIVKQLDGTTTDDQAADAIRELIAKIPALKDIKKEDAQTIYAAQNALDSAAKEVQDLFGGTGRYKADGATLTAAREKVDELVVEDVNDFITDLKVVAETAAPADVAKAKADNAKAREMYNALTKYQKELVDAATMSKLNLAEDAVVKAEVYAAGEALKEVAKIDFTKDLTKEDFEVIQAAKAAVDTLTDAQKAELDKDNLKTYTEKALPKLAEVYDLAKATVEVTANVTYNGKAQKADAVKVVDVLGNEVADDQYAVTYDNNINAGEATVIVKALKDSKYNGTNNVGKFTIARADIAKVATITPVTKSYTGKAVYQPNTIVTVKGEALDRETEFGMVHKNNVSIKKNAQVTISGKGNYTGKIVKYFKIVPKNVKSNFTLKAGKKALTVKVDALKGGVKYQYAYRVKGTTTWKYKYSSKNTITIGSLKAGKTYEVKARGYKGTTAAGTFVASTYGNVKTVKVK